MRSENKTHPTLVRCHEGNEEWENYVNIVHNEYSRNRSGYNTQWYLFTYFVFVQRALSDMGNPGMERNYEESKENQDPERSLVIGSMNHKRLAKDSLAKNLPSDALHLNHSMAMPDQILNFNPHFEK